MTLESGLSVWLIGESLLNSLVDSAVCLSQCCWLLSTVAEKFNLDTFVEHPTVEQVYSCKKDDLVEIAIHFFVSFCDIVSYSQNIPFVRSMLKK